MKVRVSGKQMEIGEALPEKVRTRLELVVGKHFQGGAEAIVVFSREGSGFRADCTTHLDAGVVLKAEGVEMDIHRAFEASMEHLLKQIRRYKRRLKNHHDKAKAPKGVGA
jgi:ribosomal subunit interface protein